MRYAFWAAMPFVFALLLRLREHARWPGPLVAAVALVQVGSMAHASKYSYVEFSPLARSVLQRAPDLYHPEPEIFAERMAGNDNYIQPDKLYVYKVDGRPVKTLVNAANLGAEKLLCGDGGALAADNRYTDSARGWRYIDGPVRCLHGSGVRQDFGADQFAAGAGVSLASGWSGVEHNGGTSDGVWSEGPHSRLLVTPARDLHPAQFRLAGGYLDGNKRTRVKVNGIDLGWHQLDREGPLALPAAARQAVTLEIELQHEAPHSPGASDPRPMAFFLHQVHLRGDAARAAPAP
jgi:hypothetical protein